MKSLLIPLALAVILSHSLHSETVPEEHLVVADFRNGTGFTYGYGEWKDLGSFQQKGSDGAALEGPAKGGAGILTPRGIDLSGYNAVKIDLHSKGANTGPLMLVFSSDTAKLQFMIPVDRIPFEPGDEGLVLRFSEARDPSSLERIGAVKTVQVQGNFDPVGKVSVVIESIELLCLPQESGSPE